MSRFYYFGPLLYHTNLKKEDLIEIEKLCKKDPNKIHVKDLAGHIDDEFRIDAFKLNSILNEYFFDYAKTWEHFYNQGFPNFRIKSAWVNYMKAGDFNPPHVHSDDLSAVIFLKIPNELKKENEEHHKKGVISKGPGALTFSTGLQRSFFHTGVEFFPEEGDMFIFPASLQHWVFPFKSNVERVSIAYNVQFKK